MTATYTFDVFSTLDGFGSYDSSGDWGGYWGKQGPEFLDRRLALYGDEQRMVLGANTFRQFLEVLGPSAAYGPPVSGLTNARTSAEHARREDTGSRPIRQRAERAEQHQAVVSDPVNNRMRNLPTTVVSKTLRGPLRWPDATLVSGDAVDVVARLKEESEVPLRSHGSLSMNRALMAAGLVDRVQLTVFPVISGRTGADPIFRGAADFDLELLESRTLDGNTQELIYRPTRHF